MKTPRTLLQWSHQSFLRAIRLMTAVAVCIGLLSVGWPTSVAHALVDTTLRVDRIDDPQVLAPGSGDAACLDATPNDCSLRAAILLADLHSGYEVILEYGETYTLTRYLSGGDSLGYADNLNIYTDMDIDHGGLLCIGYNCETIIQGTAGWNDNIFNIVSGVTVHISGVTIKNGKAPMSGGAIYNYGILFLDAVNIKNNQALNSGGGIFNFGSLSITDSYIQSNTVTGADRTGGGIYNDGTLSISGSTIKLNSAPIGGGIDTYYGDSLSLTDSDVITNTASDGDGGGIKAAGTVTITGSTINGNIRIGSSGSGAGLYYDGANSVSISNTDISSNQEDGNVSGIYMNVTGSHAATLSNVTVDHNSPGTKAVFFSGPSGGVLNIIDGTISDNTGTGLYINSGTLHMSGGAVVSGNHQGINMSSPSTTSTIADSTISGNTATNGILEGGGIALAAGGLLLTNSTVTGNSLSYPGHITQGGGISVGGAATLSINRSTVDTNTADTSAGIFSQGTLTLMNSTISMNHALNGIGGLFLFAGTASMTNTTIAANQAAVAYSGLSVNPAVPLTMKNSLIAGNFGTGNGECNGAITSASYNLIGANHYCTGISNGVDGNLVGSTSAPIDARIGPLALNGGSTRTHALAQGSPAINAGDPSNCPSVDQTGLVRPQDGRCDIGALEYSGPDNPVPQITYLSPFGMVKDCVTTDPIIFTVNGQNFVYSSVVRWNSVALPTTYVNATQLIAEQDAPALPCFLGQYPITVSSPTPGGGVSNSVNFVIATHFHYVYLPLAQK